MQETHTDAEILAACDEDPGRFRELFDRHFPAVLSFVSRRLGPSVSEDLALDTFATAFTRRRSFDVRQAGARPWLLGIATNLIRHHHRAERRRLMAYARTGADFDLGLDPGFDAAETRIQSKAAATSLAAALASLRQHERDVLLLYAWEDLTYEEIATALAIPVGTVRSRLFRARTRLRAVLGVNVPSLDEDPNEGRAR